MVGYNDILLWDRSVLVSGRPILCSQLLAVVSSSDVISVSLSTAELLLLLVVPLPASGRVNSTPVEHKWALVYWRTITENWMQNRPTSTKFYTWHNIFIMLLPSLVIACLSPLVVGVRRAVVWEVLNSLRVGRESSTTVHRFHARERDIFT